MKRDASAAAHSAKADIARNTTSPTRTASIGSSPPAATPADEAAVVTGGATAPDEEDGFGHGVDGLKPRTEVPASGTGLTPQPPSSGGATAPADAPANSSSSPSTPSATSVETVAGSPK
jgi:hypothetical protein